MSSEYPGIGVIKRKMTKTRRGLSVSLALALLMLGLIGIPGARAETER